MPVIWIIEDNAAFRRATQRALVDAAGGQPPPAFADCESALAALAAGERPEVVLLDIGLPGIDGIEGIARIKAVTPETTLLVLTVFEDDDKIFRAICAGASGYLLKSEPMARVREAIDQALAGGSPMNPRVARRVLGMFSRLAPTRTDYGLNEREHAVLALMVEGRNKKEVAARLDLNPHTVGYVTRCIYRKLHVNCLAEAVSRAVKDRVVEP